jgi:sulfite reductase (ferredoxin)
MSDQKKLSAVEKVKAESRGLRGVLAEELAAPGPSVSEESYQLLKFHGTYEQHDRDTATLRKQQGQEKDYQFMVRVRMPGGVLSGPQYLALDALADRYGNGTLRVTTRGGIQFHGVIKRDLKATIREINQALLTTQCACGDVVRNVTTTPAPRRDARHRRLLEDARLLSERLLPASRAYHEIFLDEAVQAALGHAPEPEPEPLYGPTYLPRKFKIGLALPEDNTIDVLTNDLAFIGLAGDGATGGEALTAYIVAVGGGLGMTHNKPDTYPRLATPITVIPAEDLLSMTEAVIKVQRDFGDRGDRRHARLKYLLDRQGIGWFRDTLAQYWGRPLAPPPPLPRLELPEILGWHAQGDGRFWYGVPVPAGRIQDTEEVRLRSALRAIVAEFGADPVMTPQQDVLLSNLPEGAREPVEALLRAHGVRLAHDLTPLARFALACPALPTCGLALTEAERIRAPLVAAFEAMLAAEGLEGLPLILRLTGCPNGCARPYNAEIGIVGRMPGHYAVFVGGDRAGTRLGFKLFDKVAEADLIPRLAPLFRAYRTRRAAGEGFGDFCARLGPEALLALAEEVSAAA